MFIHGRSFYYAIYAFPLPVNISIINLGKKSSSPIGLEPRLDNRLPGKRTQVDPVVGMDIDLEMVGLLVEACSWGQERCETGRNCMVAYQPRCARMMNVNFTEVKPWSEYSSYNILHHCHGYKAYSLLF
jgi:hypothetical protein